LIDIEIFKQIDRSQWQNILQLDVSSYLLLSCIRDGWNIGISHMKTTEISKQINTTNLEFKMDYDNMKPLAVKCGYIADFSHLPIERAILLDKADQFSTRTGKGFIYSELTVLGFKEYRLNKGYNWTPIGINNEKFLLKRRKVPNGIQSKLSNGANQKVTRRVIMMNNSEKLLDSSLQSATYSKLIVAEMVSDPSKDYYQFGRSNDGSNDFVIRGPIKLKKNNSIHGSVSRYAMRIECERLPPYQCLIYAGGFNCSNELILDSVTDDIGDGVTTFGVRILKPGSDCWLEISVKGKCTPTAISADLDYSNELVDNTIIDLSGALLLFRKSNYLTHSKYTPDAIISQLNYSKPQCPVLLHDLYFVYTSSRERQFRALKRLEESDQGFIPYGDIVIPMSDHYDIEDDRKPYIFPNCGHVQGFHRSMVGSKCPICRAEGPFVPLNIPCEFSICADIPTHVFNPCGCAGAKSTCEKWSKLKLPVPYSIQYDEKSHSVHTDYRGICPFCCCELDNNKPFTRIILNTDKNGFEPVEPAPNNLEINSNTIEQRLEQRQRQRPCKYPKYFG